MQNLPAELLRLIPSTYRCWRTLGMVCRAFRGALPAVVDYHELRGYTFYMKDKVITYAEYSKMVKDNLIYAHFHRACLCVREGQPTWIQCPENDPDCLEYNGNRCAVWQSEAEDMLSKDCAYVIFNFRAYFACSVELLAAFLYYEFPVFPLGVGKISVESAADHVKLNLFLLDQMDQLPADVLQVIPQTHRCWRVLSMVCRALAAAVPADGYHRACGYTF
jgi:hypothetical protein